MKLAIAGAAALSLIAGAAMAQTSSTHPSSSASQPSGAQSSNAQASGAQTATAQKIKNDLQSAGFTDVNVAAESFFVQAKTKDGDPVMMTIGPHGMSMIEAVGGKSSSSSSTSSNPGSSNGASSSSSSK